MKKKAFLFLATICLILVGCGSNVYGNNNHIESAKIVENTTNIVEEIMNKLPEETQQSDTSDNEIEDLRIEYDEEGNYIPIGYAYLEVEELLQNPELPTGCEAVSLTALLKYYGYTDLSKTYIVDNYLIYSKTGNCADGFIGSPYSTRGSGCFANVMRQVADNYLYDKHSKYAAYDFSGADLLELYRSLDYGDPVLIWNTIDMIQPAIDKSDLKVGDNTFYHYEHCLVLMGYNIEENVLYIMDPLIGIIERNIDDFYNIYCKCGKYAVVIWEGDPVPSSENGFGLE